MQEEFAEKANLAEQKRLDDLSAQKKDFENQIGDIRQANINAAAAASAKHVTEVKNVQKSVDKRVADAKKNAEKKYMFKAQEIQSIATARVMKAEERAEQAQVSANESIRAIRGTSDQMNRDYVFGSSFLIGDLTQKLIKQKDKNAAEKISDAAKSVVGFSVCRTNRGILVSKTNQAGIKVLKFYKKQKDGSR